MIADILYLSLQEGQAYRQANPASDLQDAQAEARRRWPEEPYIGLCRAFFLSGWVQAGFEDGAEPAES
ncbi:hypothetical protein [Methylomagnum ishizawai]|uniref:hypothetical protein n=1 Tax=Methylomagnum ishizawai TaxID=1760988 RepID=UPI001C32E12D|nr:hypothetical protein [Methylomagnum ishizawai]BBL75328.1 hypothetical protein MishRS11D_24260 [Methylomagnum ishizawai]